VGAIVYAAGAAAARERRRAADGFAWMSDEAEALAIAAREGRPVILDFWAEWCVACKELDRIAWSDPRVQEEAGRFVAVKLDGTDGSEAFQAITEKYGIVGMPTVVFIDPRGREVPRRVTSAVSPDEMIETLRGVDAACEGRVARPVAPAAAGGPPVAVACAPRW
jgi:thiol:disulfide interchange protein DsbD